jgi:hypothetical protein
MLRLIEIAFLNFDTIRLMFIKFNVKYDVLTNSTPTKCY